MSTDDDLPEHRSGRLLVVGLVLIAALTVGYFLVGMPGMDHSSTTTSESSTGQMDMNAMAPTFRSLDPVQWERQSRGDGAFVVNVHTPYAGEIAGTSAFIAFDKILNDPALPQAKGTPIVLYCRTGRMSKIAAQSLSKAGYRNVVDLKGGMVAWAKAGKSIATKPSKLGAPS